MKELEIQGADLDLTGFSQSENLVGWGQTTPRPAPSMRLTIGSWYGWFQGFGNADRHFASDRQAAQDQQAAFIGQQLEHSGDPRRLGFQLVKPAIISNWFKGHNFTCEY